MDFGKLLKTHGIRPTTNRVLVLRVLVESVYPLSLKELEQRIVILDKSSVFRCLRLFADHHVIHVIEDGSGALKYELCHAEHTEEHSDLHPHFYCESCKRTICLTNIPLPVIQISDGSIVRSANYVLKGLCADCIEK